MDGIANVARQQQSQVNAQEVQTKATEQIQNVAQSTKTEPDATKMQELDSTTQTKTQEDQKKVEDLVNQLNDAMKPLSPDIKFGVDSNDVFYVAAIDTKTNQVIRRFPAEQAADFLPKMQEVSGILFDSKG